MEDNFDKYLKHELDSISNAPISSQLWDKEKSWKAIASGLKPQAKSVSIGWFYAAASVALILLLGSSLYYKNSSTQLSLMRSENSRLLQMIAAENKLAKQNGNKPREVVTVVQTKETVKRVFVQNTVYIHDTVTIASVIMEPASKLLAENNQQPAADSLVILLADKQEKRNKLHFVIANEPNTSKEENKFTVIGSKNLFPKEQPKKREDVTLKLALN